MPSRAKIVTRSNTTSTNTTDNLGKGSKLSFAEMDSNFIELQNQTIGLVGDDSTGIDVAAGNTIKIAGSGGIQTSVSGDTVTIDASSISSSSLGDITAVGSTLLSPSNADFTLQASGTGSIQLADSTNVTGDLTVTGSLNTDGITIEDNRITTSRSNDSLQLRANGTGDIELNPEASTYQQVVIRGGGQDGLSVIHPQLKIVDEQGTELLFGDNWALASTGATIASGSGDILTLQGGNQDQNINARTPNFNIFSGTTGKLTLGQSSGSPTGRHPGEIATTYNTADGQGFDLKLNTGSSSATDPGKLLVGTSAHNATISSNGAHNLVLETNSGTNSGYIGIGDGADGNINITPYNGGTGQVQIGNVSTVSSGDSGGGTVELAGIFFREPGGLSNAGRHTFNAIEIPFSADGSTSSDMYIGLDINADPYIHFNRAGDLTNGAKIKTLTGSMTIQTDGANSSAGNIRIQAAGDITLAPSGVLNLGSDTIVVSGNRMYTDASNEDMELLANGVGNISLLSPANMNSNKIINVTDPTSAQDAATKAYVDAQIGTATTLTTDGLTITDNNITGTRSNEDIEITAAGTGAIAINSNIDFQNNATLAWDDTNKTISVQYAGFARHLNLGQETQYYAKASAAIAAGDVVMFTGVQGDHITVAKADMTAAGFIPEWVVGVAKETMALNDFGYITAFGKVTNLTTNTFSVGDLLWLNPATPGGLVNSPTDGGYDYRILIAAVITSSAGNGTIQVRPTIEKTHAITVVGDDSTGTRLDLAETFKIAGTQNITTAVSGDTVTITGPDLTSYITASSTDTLTNKSGNISQWTNDAGYLTTETSHADVVVDGDFASQGIMLRGASAGTYSILTDNSANWNTAYGWGDHASAGYTTASSSDTLTNKTIDANGTGNSISNIEVADFAASSIVTAAEGIASNDNDTTIPTSAAVKAYADSVGGGAANTGDITFVGSTIISPSNADLVLNPSGTGSVNINAVYTLPNTDGTANQIMATNGSGVISFVDPTAINIDGGVADSIYVSVPTIDGGIA